MEANETLALRVHGDASLPTLIYMPGLHGDWTLVASFRAAVSGRARFAEVTYPRVLDWSLEDYARAVLDELAARGITTGWLLGESFSSLVAWKILELVAKRETGFVPQGLILAGGFVRHPVIWGVPVFSFLHHATPFPLFRLLLKGYVAYARLRHRGAPETLENISEFVTRRTKADHAAIGCRYGLVKTGDPRPVARATTLPVFQLSGLFDPIVPWWFITPWLQRNCPGFRARRVIFSADHNVLATAPAKAAEQILKWMGVIKSGSRARSLRR